MPQGSIAGTSDVGGLVGRSEDGAVYGYAKGNVNRYSLVSGLVGNNTGIAYGYARALIRRTYGSISTFGLLVGQNSGTAKGYYSERESLFTGGLIASGANSVNGVKINYETAPSPMQANFTNLDFGAVGQ